MHADLSYCVALRPTAFFKPSEEVDADHVRRLADTIRATGLWTTPIPIERETGIVMDGNHRMRAAALLGLHHLPCVLLDYADPRVSVTHWGSGAPFSVAGIRQRIVAERRLFPYKTTRHRFAPALPSTEIPLTMLGTPHDVRAAALA